MNNQDYSDRRNHNGSNRRWQQHSDQYDDYGNQNRNHYGNQGYQEEGMQMAPYDQNFRRSPHGSEDQGRWQQNQGYGGPRGNYGMQNQQWEDAEFGGQQRGFGRGNAQRGQYGPTRDQYQGGYGGNQGGYGGYQGGYQGGYGGGMQSQVGPNEPGGNFYAGQSRSAQYGGGQSYGGRYGQQQYGSGQWEQTHRMIDGSSSQWSPSRGNSDSQYGQSYRQNDFSGRGPKDYQRSSQRIREEVCDYITDHPGIDASDISLDVSDDGIVELKGSVDSRRTKRMIEDCCDSVRGVSDVRNLLSVDDNFWSRDQSNQSNRSNQSNQSNQSKSKSSSSS